MPRASRWRLRCLALGLWAVGLAWAGPARATAQFEEVHFPAAGVTSLTIIGRSGNMHVRALPVDDIEVNMLHDGDVCRLTSRLRRGRLELRLVPPPGRRACGYTDLEVSVPEQLALQLKNEMGDIFVHGSLSRLRVEASYTNVTFEGTAAALHVFLRRGSVLMTGSVGVAEVHSGAGTAELVYDTLPEAGRVAVDLRHGDLILRAPAAQIAFHARLARGTLQELGVAAAPQAPFAVRGQLGEGNAYLYRRGQAY